MLDQSFSANNFIKILHYENRKGTFKRAMLSKEHLIINKKIKNLFSIQNTITKDIFNSQLELLNEEKRKAIENYIQRVSEQCNSKSFRFDITSSDRNGKTIYTIDSDAPSFFAMKQLQYNMLKTFQVKQSNRFDIVKQLRVILEDGFPKYIVRIDVKSFYESIPQKVLFAKIEENQLLNFQSKKLLRQLIFSYENVKDKSINKEDYGIPRGIGVSAYLAELYMRDIDNEMKQISDLVYYARYVDDIVLIFIPHSEPKKKDYYSTMKEIITRHELTLKDGSDGEINKTYKIDLINKMINAQFDFLGYKFVIENSKLKELRLSDSKLKKYETRLEATVEAYNINSKNNEKKARKILINRFKFLTGNFHLVNNKKRIKSGVYYSNILVNDNSERLCNFKHLDCLIKKYVSKLNPYYKLNVNIIKLRLKIIKRYSFSEGFYNKKQRFHSFNNAELQQIVSIWKK